MKCEDCGYDMEEDDCPLCGSCEDCGYSVRNCRCRESE